MKIAFAKQFVDENFEAPSQALQYRKKARAAARKLPDFGQSIIRFGPCSSTKGRCQRATCPTCTRRMRKDLVAFADRELLHQRDWFFVTAFFAGWTFPDGDATTMPPFRSSRVVQNLRQRLRRHASGELLVIGAVDAVFIHRANVAKGTCFHVHLLVTGASKSEIRKAFATLPLDREFHVPLQIKRVAKSASALKTRQNFLESLTYCVKQPYWAAHYPDAKNASKQRSFPKPRELAQIVGHFGKRSISDRLILGAVRYEHGRFAMVKSAMKSNSEVKSAKLKIRLKSVSRTRHKTHNHWKSSH